MTFEKWFEKVNELCEKRLGMGVDDIPDMDYWVWWDAGTSVHETLEFINFELTNNWY